MPIFKPRYTITEEMATNLLQIEAARQQSLHLPLTPAALHSLRESARMASTHYSTMIEGNRLTLEQVQDVIQKKQSAGRQRDEQEVRGYYAALLRVEQWARSNTPITDTIIKTIHALVMHGRSKAIKPTPYRDGQNIIRDGVTHAIVYLPPEARDVSALMKSLVHWIKHSIDIPAPIVAALVHYQFVTIHPYYDGNGRTARLLATLVLFLRGYDMQGIYSLDEYYARNLGAYYDALNVGPSHNYYEGRAEADLTHWIEYFVAGMAYSCDRIIKHLKKIPIDNIATARSQIIRSLDVQQRQVLELFKEHESVSSQQIGDFFGYQQRTSSQLCKKWIESGFIESTTSAKRGRRYRLTQKYLMLID